MFRKLLYIFSAFLLLNCAAITSVASQFFIVDEDIVVVIDALAARSTKRLARTIQISNTGIQPGSGVGNHRNSLTKESLGIPVIAIGIPTVDAATIVNDAIERIHTKNSPLLSEEANETLYDMHNMYVTTKDIDATIKMLGFTLSEALNIAFDIHE